MKQPRRTPASRMPRPVIAPRIETPFTAYAVGIFALALALRLLHVFQLRHSPFFDVLLGDAHAYDEWARRIANGEWIGRDVFYQAPLYPYFLGTIYAIVGHSLLAVRLVQAVVGAASCVLLGLAVRHFFSTRAGIAAGIALAIYAPAIFFDGLLQKSVLDIFFLALALWLISGLLDTTGRRRAWLALGLTMGALSLTRENALVFVLVIVGWSLFRRVEPRAPFSRRVAPVGAFVLGLAIVLLPVAIRNYAVGGGFYLTTSQFGPNFFIGNNPKADGTYMSLRFGRGAPEYERQDATDLAEHALGRTLTPAQVSNYWTDQALDFITVHPTAWIRLMGRKFVLLWNATEMLDTEAQESYAEWSWPLRLGGWFGHFGVLVPLALIGALFAWSDRRRLAILYTMTVAYAASVLLFYVFARYRLPLVPLMMPFAAQALVTLPGWIRQLRETGVSRPLPLIASVATIVMVAVLANWPTLSVSLMKAITENNLATALQTEGRPQEALAHYQRAIAIQPDYAPAYNNMGVVLRAGGQIDQAIASYQRALAVNNDYPDAHYNLANALLDKREPAAAAEHFRIALRSIPDSAGVRNNLGIALAAEGKHDDAIAAFRAAVTAEPTSAKAYRNLGDALSAAGQSDEAITALRRATALDPRDAASHYDLGSVLLEAGQLEPAIAEFRATLQLTPQSIEAHNNLGIALGSQGRLDAAIEQFEQALAINPGFVDSQRNLAMATQARDSLRRGRR
jgi:tetratricopeptide (TPR) repeat protein